MLHRITRCLVVLLFVCAGAGKLSACVTDSPNFSTAFRNDIDADLDDWGALTIDANDPNCAHAAANRLVEKLRNTTSTTHFSDPLVGYSVALIYAAAVRLGSYGWFNTQPDPYNSLTYQLDLVKNSYTEASQAVGCGTGFEGNSCMDDYAGEAAAWAWMALYMEKHGQDAMATVARADNRIDNFFDNVCIFSQSKYDNPNDPGYLRICNGNVADLQNNTGYVFAFEHDRESPHYGFGLLTSIAGALTGLQAAGDSKILTSDQQWKVRGMWGEIQMHINNWYGLECKKPVSLGNGQYSFTTNVTCADQNYDPSMYDLHDFLVTPVHGNFTPPFDQYQATGGFNWDGIVNPFTDHFGYGRRVTYNEQASDWYDNRGDPSRYMPDNLHGAQGYLDQVTNSGVAQGWACDADAPNGTVKVDFYVGNTLLPEDPSQFPNTGSEQEVNNLCGGGSYHRFFVQLPMWAQGQPIYAVARDYTTGSLVNLTCLEGPVCSW